MIPRNCSPHEESFARADGPFPKPNFKNGPIFVIASDLGLKHPSMYRETIVHKVIKITACLNSFGRGLAELEWSPAMTLVSGCC